MKKIALTIGIVATLLFVSPMVGAETRNQADFEPVIIYQDTDLIAKSKGKASTSAQSAVITEKAENAGQLLSQNLMIVLVAAGLGGFIFWSSKRSGASAGKTVASAPVVAQSNGSSTTATGVAKYIEGVKNSEKSSAPAAVAVAMTGVSKYLKNLESAAKPVASAPVVTAVAAATTAAAPAAQAENVAVATGVEKYLKKLEPSAKTNGATTGVAKYLANLEK